MREVIRDIFTGSNSVFTGKFLASFLMFPIFFASMGASFPETLTNTVDESAIHDSGTVSISEIKEPDAGNALGVSENQQASRRVPVDIVDYAPVSYDLTIGGKVSTNVIGVGLDSSGAVAVPGNSAGYYNANGAHLLVGHNTGVFAGLLGVSVGDIVTLWGENYQVYGSNIYNYDPSVGVYNSDGSMNGNGQMMYDSLYSGGSTGLNLMTCHGQYLHDYGTYNQRLVVFAKKI